MATKDASAAPSMMSPPPTRDVVMTRVLDAPRNLVWKAWTDPEHLRRWWGPKGYTAPTCTIDLRVGGRYHWCMRAPDGHDLWTTGVYRELVRNERIVYTNCFADADGNVVPATRYGMGADIPLEMLVTVTLTERDGRTVMTVRHGGLPANMMESAATGWGQSFDKLAVALDADGAADRSATADREIVITRVVRAPRELVFAAFTDPEHVVHWWGPNGFSTTVLEMDVRPGGTWRFIMHGPDGVDYDNRIVYTELVAPERIAYVHGADRDDDPDRFDVTTTFADEGGATRVTMRMVAASAKARDDMAKFGAIEGGNQTLERLERYLAGN